MLEQTCLFADIDGVDPDCHHLLGRAGARDEPDGTGAGRTVGLPAPLCADARLVPPGRLYAEASIGRILTSGSVGGAGWGKALMAEALAACQRLYPATPIRIGAQRHLEGFYRQSGFRTVSEPYDEDGISHVEMLLSP